MSLISSLFDKRLDDIEDSFKFLCFFDSLEPWKNETLLHSSTEATLDVTQVMQSCNKAQFLLLLYNLVEATIYNCIIQIYDAILDEELKCKDLSNDLQELCISYLKKSEKSFANLPREEQLNTLAHFNDTTVNIQGNLDLRKIVEVIEKHGCKLSSLINRDEVGNSFYIVKQQRNDLAHGNVSFSECGSKYLLSDLQQYKNHIISTLRIILQQVDDFILQKKYKNQSFESCNAAIDR